MAWVLVSAFQVGPAQRLPFSYARCGPFHSLAGGLLSVLIDQA